MQFTVAGALSAVFAVIFERPTFDNIIAAAPQILYLGIVSSGVGYTLQIVGQKYAEPSVASLSMSLESVFAALGGWLDFGKYALRQGIYRLCACICGNSRGANSRNDGKDKEAERFAAVSRH